MLLVAFHHEPKRIVVWTALLILVLHPSSTRNISRHFGTAFTLPKLSTRKTTNRTRRLHSSIHAFVQSPVNDTEKFLARNSHWLLLVDDEEAIRQSVGDYLFDAGYQVTACADAESAMQVLKLEDTTADGTRSIRTTLPSCAILDIRMPGGPDGIELLHWIRSSNTNLQRVPVIMLTAKGMTGDRIRGYNAGCDFYLSKPFVPEELLSMIDAAIRKPQSPLEDVLSQVQDIKAQLQKQGTTQNNKNKTESSYVYLTPAERNVLGLLCDGLTNQEISDMRNTSKIMVHRHLQNIYRKSQTNSRTKLVRWAIQNGFVPAKRPIT